MDIYKVNLHPRDAANTIVEYVNKSGISPELVGSYSNVSADGSGEVVFLVFEKYYMRTSSRASLSVIIENVNGYTQVASQGSGGGEGALWKFDWGASKNFAGLVRDALSGYIIN